jgi:glycosyltransferase involved in cell wall biosynthesis
MLKRSILYISFSSAKYRSSDDLFAVQESSLLYKSALAEGNNVHYLLNSNLRFSGRYFEIEISSLSRNAVSFMLFAIRYIKRKKFDAVIVHDTGNFLQAACIRILTGSVTILQHHGEQTFRRKKAFLLRWYDRFIAAYFFNGSEVARPFIKRGLFPVKKVFEVTEGTTDFTFDPQRPPNTRKKLIAVGRLNENKNFLTLLKALKIVVNSTPDFEVALYYSTSEQERELKEYTVNNGLSAHVNFKGKVAHDALEEIFNQSDIFVSCSLREGSGYALIEALACGVFPVVSRIPSFEYLLSGLESKRMFEPSDENELANMLSEAMRLEITHASRIEIRWHFESRASAQGIAKQVNDALDALLIK